ncbi:mercury(II) reductase [Maritalea sp. S77]|uniref:mercury(II) reductase n=1 Tax=Maritalea sp. S77 TaxID=3415125 RepID=UPI003C7CA38B
MSDCCSNGTYDLAVIGAGSAGFSAAITAADSGARVALIGYGTIGGTCVNVGCVPSKALIRATEALHASSAAKRFNGIEVTSRLTSWSDVVRQKQQLVDELRGVKYADLLPSYENVDYIEGQASFGKDGALFVDGTAFAATKIVIATGTRPSIPSINGIKDVPYLTSTTALEQETLPSSMLVIGAGYIGVELAQIFARAGVDVTLVSRRGVLPEAEPEIGAALAGYLSDEGISIVSGISYDRIAKHKDGVELIVFEDGSPRTIVADKVLLATGRTPNIESLNLQNKGVVLNDVGGIKVDKQMRSSANDVFAAGDVTGEDQFVYMAAYGAKIAAKSAMGLETRAYDNMAMPAVVFSDPQVASVGLTEAQAQESGFSVKTSILTLENVPRALAARDTRGVIKLVANAQNGILLGAHILAPEGADSIQTAAMAIKCHMTYQELADMIFPYLTTVEGLKLAAQTFDMDVKKLSCCAG